MIRAETHPPEASDHPILHRWFAESQTPRARWAAEYTVSRSDARYLDATDEDVLHDLAVLQYTRGRARLAADRDAASRAYAEANVESLREGAAALARQLAGATNPGLVEQQPDPEQGRITTIRRGQPR